MLGNYFKRQLIVRNFKNEIVKIKSPESALNSKLHCEGEADEAKEHKNGNDRQEACLCDG